MTNTPELVARLVRNGGKILLVGGGLADLPDSIANHAQILIWDDHDMSMTRREVPTNTKVIMYNRWVSHETAKKLSRAAENLHAIKFPMLKNREIKELLAEFLQAEPAPEAEVNQVEVAEPVVEVTEGTGMAKKIAKKGEIQEFLAKKLDITKNYDVKGSISKEGDRIYAMAKDAGISTTPASVKQAIGKMLQNLKKAPSVDKAPVRHRADKTDDFEQLNIFIQDAIAAMKLVQEHLPKVRKETERLRGMKDKVLKMFGDD